MDRLGIATQCVLHRPVVPTGVAVTAVAAGWPSGATEAMIQRPIGRSLFRWQGGWAPAPPDEREHRPEHRPEHHLEHRTVPNRPDANRNRKWVFNQTAVTIVLITRP